jgi:hypothetical protein
MSNLENEIIEALQHTVANKEPSMKIKDIVLSNSYENATKRTRNLFLKRLSYCTAAFALALVLLVTSALISPVMAQAVSNVPIIGSIINLIGDKGLKNAYNQGFAATTNQVADDNGIRLTFNDVLYDDARISIGFTEECSGGYKDFLDITTDILINNKLADSCSIGISHKDAGKDTYIGILNIELNEDNNVEGSATKNGMQDNPKFFTGKLPDEFILGFKIKQVDNIKGNWDFSIPVSKKKSQAVTKVFNPNVSKEHNGITLSVPKVKFTPSCVELTAILTPFGKSDICTYRVYDEKGKELEPIDNSGTEPIYMPLADIPHQLKLVPYTNSIKTVKKEITKQFPITISQGNLGEVTINNIEFLPDKTLIHYDFIGKKPADVPERIEIIGQVKGDESNIRPLGLSEGRNKMKAPVKIGKNSYIQEYEAIEIIGKIYATTIAEVDAKPVDALTLDIPLK